MKALRIAAIAAYTLLATLPIVWLAVTALKSRADAIAPALRLLPVPEAIASETGLAFPARTGGFSDLAAPLDDGETGFLETLGNSLLIGILSTAAAVALGTTCAFGFSRFRIAGARDWLFFILSTRFLPPLAVVVPVLLMYRELDLQNTHAGLILLYTSFNLSLSVWLMKGFIDEIPRAYEEAAAIDGYSRTQIFFRIIVPEARTGMAVTAVFCLISAFNEYGFAMTLNDHGAVTVPRYFAGLQGSIEGLPWPRIAAGALLFVAPIIVFTYLVRRHLLRGVTFGTVKQ